MIFVIKEVFTTYLFLTCDTVFDKKGIEEVLVLYKEILDW